MQFTIFNQPEHSFKREILVASIFSSHQAIVTAGHFLILSADLLTHINAWQSCVQIIVNCMPRLSSGLSCQWLLHVFSL
jgi:hypothetical protein